MKAFDDKFFKIMQAEYSQTSQNFEKTIIANLFTKRQPALALA